jgi:hypothetical protein
MGGAAYRLGIRRSILLSYGVGRSHYRRVHDRILPEDVCAENTHEYYAGKDTAIPTADKPDF